MKVYINGLGHMTKMAAMAINSKNLYGYFTIRVANIIGNYLVKFMNTSGVPFTT